jgi:hypothetical protein
LKRTGVCLTRLFDFIGVNSALGPTQLEQVNITRWPHSWALQGWLNAPPWIVRHMPGQIRGFLVKHLRVWNANKVKPPTLDPTRRHELTELYRDEILRLQDFIGRDLSHWLAAP